MRPNTLAYTNAELENAVLPVLLSYLPCPAKPASTTIPTMTTVKTISKSMKTDMEISKARAG
ncbi:hypothetical protein [Undibacterium sp. TC9W]|uniref:hypothetical protein n=1 Tax=Undibacterium sp. TC9W TaxID=3413053 RepID=UPI003BF278B1